MPTSRPLVEGDRVVAITDVEPNSRLYTVGDTYLLIPVEWIPSILYYAVILISQTIKPTTGGK